MAAAAQFISRANNRNVQFENALLDAGDIEIWQTSAEDGGVVTAILISSDDTVEIVVTLSLLIDAVTAILAKVTIPPGAGTSVDVPAVNLLDPMYIPGIDEAPNRALRLAAEDGLRLSVPNTDITAGKTIYACVLGGDY